ADRSARNFGSGPICHQNALKSVIPTAAGIQSRPSPLHLASISEWMPAARFREDKLRRMT
ncbi:MAG: hypothetical protein AB7V39_29715, partial [Nitrospiraceae bacterium]